MNLPYMMKTFVTVVIFLLFVTCLHAQKPTDAITGSYFLDGVKGITSGFTLKPNYTFTFFYTKGTLTRTGSGRWDAENNTVTFTSRLKPPRDFKLLSAKKVNDNFVTVIFSDDNPAYVGNIQCILYTARGRQKLFTNENGIVQFTRQEVDSIQISSPLFPDHPFTFIALNKVQNNFEFSFEKWVTEVFFEDFPLQLSNNMLIGKHPLLPGNSFRYVKDN